MKRMKSTSGVVHFAGCNGRCLCGVACEDEVRDLIGVIHKPMKETPDPVTCKDCAKLYCEIKNAPWHEVTDAAMEHGMFACGDSVWCGACGNAGCEMRGADRIVKCGSFIREGAVQ